MSESGRVESMTEGLSDPMETGREGGKRFHGPDDDGPTFEENVLAEERVRQRTLHAIRFQSRQRQDSMSSEEAGAGRIPSSPGGGGALPGEPPSGRVHSDSASSSGAIGGLSIAAAPLARDGNGVMSEVDVRQELFEEPEAYLHAVDFQRVIITDVDGKSNCSSSVGDRDRDRGCVFGECFTYPYIYLSYISLLQIRWPRICSLAPPLRNA
jgi:hypothetical protein